MRMRLHSSTLPQRRAAWIIGVIGCFAAALAAAAAGCASPLTFPAAPLSSTQTPDGLVAAYDTRGGGKADYFTTQNAGGRIVRIAYEVDGHDKPGSFVDLDQVPIASAQQIVFILDGVGYEMVDEFRKEGRLRLFHPPARVISTFPAMTDIALGDIFRSVPCIGLEAVYFDHAANKIMGGDSDYLSMKNEDWARDCDYRAPMLIDALAYIKPDPIYNHELATFLKLFERRDRPMIVAYFVATAGLGTIEGADGQRKVLDRIDRLSEELVWRTRGLVKITIFSDHGHTLTKAEHADFKTYLAGKGWRPAEKLERPKDVVQIEYGFITYASFATAEREALASDLIGHPAVDLVTYQEGDAVAVQSPAGKAVVERRGNRYCYRTISGDPLDLVPLVDAAKKADPSLFDTDGFAEDRAWLKLTFTHRYPDAPDRLWRAFHGMVQHTPDVIASLKREYVSGWQRPIYNPKIASTHGDLDIRSSSAFIMSTSMPITPRWPFLRSRDLPDVLPVLTGRPWPPAARSAP
jgi:hypothetical protein